MEMQFLVENIRCGGCVNTISSKLNAIDGVEGVEVDIESQAITVQTHDGNRELIANSLLSMGYPEQGTVEGLDALKGKAKSVVSCAIGKMK
ncbi:MAG: Heavy metal transporter [uncultured Thiotrichaceae bacterium]|uniref:Heavy metal transporter n=1 Tax=uncultured Thiotrichaceae bacterium TaxID=298394 RepID=A0A6S6SVA8_9GAMM|nr:MAG: Heavy metal transporter [uncultured Thiotrichaceae bacterium]